jgi:Ku protein
VKGVREGDTFTEVPDEEIVKGYEYAKGQHVLIGPKEIDELKLEAKHTIDMRQFVEEDEIDSRYWEKPYYLVPDGDEADEGYAIMQRALAETGKVAVGQLIMHGASIPCRYQSAERWIDAFEANEGLLDEWGKPKN